MEPLIAEIERTFEELERQLGDPELIADQRSYAQVARRHKALSRAHALAQRWRQLTAQQAEAEELAADPDEEMRAFAQEQLAEARAELPDLEEEIRLEMLERDPGRRQGRDRRGACRHRRRRGRAVRRRPDDDVRPLRRVARLQDGDAGDVFRRGRRLQGGRARDPRRRRLLGVQVRERRAPRAARAGNRVAGADPHVDRDRDGAAGGRGRRDRRSTRTTCGSTSSAPAATAASR